MQSTMGAFKAHLLVIPGVTANSCHPHPTPRGLQGCGFLKPAFCTFVLTLSGLTYILAQVTVSNNQNQLQTQLGFCTASLKH